MAQGACLERALKGEKMTGTAATIECRMACACACAYGIRLDGRYVPPTPFADAVGWLDAPKAIAGGVGPGGDIDAALIGANDQDGIILAFRGTLPPVPFTPAAARDWFQDVFLSKPEESSPIPGKVHSGFVAALETIWEDIVRELGVLQARHPEKDLIVTGHSKGGGMAGIAAAKLHFRSPGSPQPRSVFTYASPHAGDSEFVAAFPYAEIAANRYENYLDIVPFLPPEQQFIHLAEQVPLIGELFKEADGWDYAPLGTLFYIDRDHQVETAYPLLDYLRLLELLAAMLRGEKGFAEIADAHSLDCGGGYMSGVCPAGVCP